MSHSLQRSPASNQILAQAIALFNGGRPREAEAMVRHVLTFEPVQPDALNLLGSILLHAGQPEASIGVLTLAVEHSPRAMEPRINLGHALKATGQPTEAIESYRAAVRLKPRDGQARYALGGGLMKDGQYSAAAVELREATRLLPRFAGAFNNLGYALRQLERPREAETAFRRALRLEPGRAETHLNLALALGEQQRTEDAITGLRDALRLSPDHVDALHGYGTLLVKTRRFQEAIAPLRRLRALRPGTPDPFAGLTQALTVLGEFDEAMELARETVHLEPDSAGARSNLGATLLSLGCLADAEREYEAALRLDPGFAAARVGRAFARMRAGCLEEAWDDYEARLSADLIGSTAGGIAMIDPGKLSGDPWTGDPRNGRSLLVYPEQGLGDAIQMARYAPLLAVDGPLLWAVPHALRRLMTGLSGVSTLLTPGDPVPSHDLHCSVMSLPRMFRTSLATIPGDRPWLHADPDQTAAWRARLSDRTGRKIGIAWKGNPDYLFDGLRSVPADRLCILEDARDAVFVSLQVPRPDAPPPLCLIDMTSELKDFADTAALMAALDLIVTVDTSIAHLAGALGRPVWLLNRVNSDWRWLQGRTDSPWYPTMRIFTQSSPGDWDGVLNAVRSELDGLPAPARNRA